MAEIFRKFAGMVSAWTGSSIAFCMALFLVVGWALSGPYFHYSDSWELIINTATTIITFLMVFLIQNSQNRDMKSLNLKLDELIFANKKARNSFLNLEKMTDTELHKLEEEFQHIIATKREIIEERKKKTHK